MLAWFERVAATAGRAHGFFFGLLLPSATFFEVVVIVAVIDMPESLLKVLF